jgi:hypothetical protein
MNPWVHGSQIVTLALSVSASIAAFTALFVVIWKRRQIEDFMKTRPYPKPPTYRWVGVAIGAASLVVFEFVVMPHVAIHLSLRYHIFVSIVGVSVYVVLMAALFSFNRRMRTWPLATRLRTMYIMLVAACILAAVSLFYAFS